MMINGSLPVLRLAQEQSSPLSLQQTSESGSGDFSALLFLIFASPTSRPVATATDGQLAEMESGSTTNGALSEKIEENPGDNINQIHQFAVADQSQNNVMGPLGLKLLEQASITAAEETADSSEPFLARLQGQLSALAHGSFASQVQQLGVLPPLASDRATPGAESESPLSSIEQSVSILPDQQQASATEKTVASFVAPKEPTEFYRLSRPEAHLVVGAGRHVSEEEIGDVTHVDVAPRGDAIVAEAAADGKRDIIQKLSDGEKPQPIPNAAVNQKITELSYEKISNSFKIVLASNSEFSANGALPTVNAAAKNGVFVVSSSPAQAVTKPTEVEWSGEKAAESPHGEKLTINQKIEAVSSAMRDQSATFEFDSRGDRAPSDSFKNSAARSDISNLSSNFSAISLRATENDVTGDTKPNIAWSPTINHVAAEIAGNLRRNKHEAVITLDPPELGKLKIGLTVDGDKVQVRIFVEARESQGLIENHLSDLKQALVSHHLDLVDVRVDGGSWSGSSGGGDLMHGFQHNPGGQQESDWGFGSSPRNASEIADPPTSDGVSEKGRVSIRA
jgi:flagellar hook-length control protein FliK